MAHKERLSMDMQEQIRILYEREYSTRRIAKCLKKSRKTVRRYLDKFETQKNAKLDEAGLQRQIDEKKDATMTPESWMTKVNWEEATLERAKGISYKT